MIGTLILKFLAGNWKILAAGAIGIFLFFQVTHWVKDYNQMKADEAQKLSNMTVERNNALISAASAQASLQEVRINAAKVEAQLALALTRQDEIRAEAKAEREKFEGHDLTKMANRHNEWMEKLVNRGTQKRLDSIEDAFND